jgi:AraC family transcriptional activator of pobA
MTEKTDIITFTKFNDYYAAANTPLRSMHDEFHVFRFSDLGDEIVPQMGPFSIAYFQMN